MHARTVYGSRVHVALRRALAIAVALFSLASSACAADPGTSAGANDAVRRPPSEVLSLPVRVDAGANTAFAAALSDALARAGFMVLTDANARAVVVLTPQVAVGEVVGTDVNGRARARIEIVVAVTCDGQNADSLHSSYTALEGNPPDEEAIGTLVLAYAHSARVAAFAKDRSARSQEEASDEIDWVASEHEKCLEPRTREACERVKEYLRKHPRGRYAAEATPMVAQAPARLAAYQKDERSWQAAGVTECRAKRTREACVGLEVYVTRFPSGLHAEEANQLLHR